MTIQGNIVDIKNRRIYHGEINFENGKIIGMHPIDGKSTQYILPGFVDAHIHIESSMLVPSEFARLAVLQGTVATVSDPHEIANVMGIEGVKYMIENGKKTPFKFNFGGISLFTLSNRISPLSKRNSCPLKFKLLFGGKVYSFPLIIGLVEKPLI